MKLSPFLFLLCCLLPTIVAVRGQAPVRGTITGRILNPNTGEYLRNARVQVEGTAEATVSEGGGEYRLSNVAAGEVTVLGPTDLASSVPHDASAMYSRNVTAFLELIVRDGRLVIDPEDEIIRGTLVVRDGELVHEVVIRSLEVEHV